MKIEVSQLIVRFLERLGIEVIFGMPGAHILPVYNHLYDSAVNSILVKHEQGAAFMAGGYARASCRIAACITTAGPGATNLVTGIANAYADKQPVLIITGEAPTQIFGKGGLQESSGEGGAIDQTALFKSITKYNKVVERTDYLAQVLNQAAKILLSPNPGPVLLSFPYNVQKELVDESILDSIKTEKHVHLVHKEMPPVEALTDAIIHAKKPVIVAGFGCINSNSQHQVAQLSELLDIPIATSIKAKGIIAEQSPLSLGTLGVTSSGYAYRYIVDEADLVIFLGASFNERTSYLWEEKLLQGKRLAQVDIDYSQLDKVFNTDIAVHGDIGDVLDSLISNIHERGVKPRMPKSADTVHQIKTADNSDYALFQSGFALPEKFFSLLEERFPTGAMVFDDNLIFAQNFYNVSSENRYYPNSGISSLGHAIPAAIGARFSEERTTFAILGDGGFQMCCMELMTAVNYRLPINVVLFNNSTMGLIRKNQMQQYDGRFINCDFTNPDFELLAQSFGINHHRIETLEDLEAMFTNADLVSQTNLIEIMLDRDLFPNYSSRR